MPAPRNLFMPSDSLQVRDPLTNELRHGNIMNPRRYMEIGGLHSAERRGFESAESMNVKSPESTQRRVPAK
jgi:hypothetical protein